MSQNRNGRGGTNQKSTRCAAAQRVSGRMGNAESKRAVGELCDVSIYASLLYLPSQSTCTAHETFHAE